MFRAKGIASVLCLLTTNLVPRAFFDGFNMISFQVKAGSGVITGGS